VLHPKNLPPPITNIILDLFRDIITDANQDVTAVALCNLAQTSGTFSALKDM
jgi:hypothetical protein